MIILKIQVNEKTFKITNLVMFEIHNFNLFNLLEWSKSIVFKSKIMIFKDGN
jgi:hypothetical protein